MPTGKLVEECEQAHRLVMMDLLTMSIVPRSMASNFKIAVPPQVSRKAKAKVYRACWLITRLSFSFFTISLPHSSTSPDHPTLRQVPRTSTTTTSTSPASSGSNAGSRHGSASKRASTASVVVPVSRTPSSIRRTPSKTEAAALDPVGRAVAAHYFQSEAAEELEVRLLPNNGTRVRWIRSAWCSWRRVLK
jgi:hypothetical protein